MSQDLVTYNQDIVKIVTEENVVNKLDDKNLSLIIQFLRAGPKTVNDLVKDFKKVGIKKSDKSIYRYLKELIEANLVAKGGKRVTSLGHDEIQSETIYVRTAKVFITDILKTKYDSLEKEHSQIFDEIIKRILEQKFPDEINSTEGIRELITKLDVEKNRLVVELFQNASTETLQLFSQLDWCLMEDLIEYVGWLALSLNLDLHKEIKKCCS